MISGVPAQVHERLHDQGHGGAFDFASQLEKAVSREQLSRRKAGQHAVGTFDDLIESGQQFRLGDRSAGRKLGRAVAKVGASAESRVDPLFDVAGQMQHQVGDAIERLAGPPPELLIG